MKVLSPEVIPQQELMRELEGAIREQLPLLKSVENSWQPSDLFPDTTQEGWVDQVKEMRRQAEGLSDEVLIVLVGNMVTEEALPTYQSALNRLGVLRDETGASASPGALWTRAWSAEENRHGDALNRYLYLTGRVDMRSVEVTIQHLIRNGHDPETSDDIYKAFVYTSFQERATKLCHANMGKIADKRGDSTLTKMCALMAGDEARHEQGYKSFFAKLLQMGPEGALLAFEDIMKRKIAMPAKRMADGKHPGLFGNYSIVAQKIGLYTIQDYADITEHLVDYWCIGDIQVSSDQALRAKDYLCGLAQTTRKKVEKTKRLLSSVGKKPFSWIFDRLA